MKSLNCAGDEVINTKVKCNLHIHNRTHKVISVSATLVSPINHLSVMRFNFIFLSFEKISKFILLMKHFFRFLDKIHCTS